MLGLSVPLLAFAACYQLFDQKNTLVLQSSAPPVDTSKSLRDEVHRLYPGHFLVVGPDGACPEIDELRRAERTVKLPAESLNRGPIQIGAGAGADGSGNRGPVRLSGDPVSTQRQMTFPNRKAPTKSLPKFFKNCTEARAAGAAPIRKGEPGFGEHLDKDGDGVACE